MTKLNLYIDGDEKIIALFSMQIQSFLDLGEKNHLIQYRLCVTEDNRTDADEIPPRLERYGKRLKKMTPELETWICKLHIERGMDRYDIAKEIKIHPETVRQVLGKFGLNKELKKPMDLNDTKEAVRLWVEENMSSREISKILGWSVTTIRTHLQAAGVMTKLTMDEVKQTNRTRFRKKLCES